MFIAVAVNKSDQVAGHIGKCPHWAVYEVALGEAGEPTVTLYERIELPKALIFHHYQDDQPHPLLDCVAVVGGSAGESFQRKMAARGLETVLTAEPDPAKAVFDWLRDEVIPAKPRPVGGLICKIRDALNPS
ncbi:MAG: hypothetical protein COX57_04650 [Alphaproteobacteria bacterium CG_4_10_14_0_2_um_filter_63_37]|nr:MAG: hypothetical protein AUJ55_13170 [Proteobacteria bacterium CG1_02_64_396]PJA25188.1 MAG: hypothetical protein COX57_04650 [Alphaproteobacteria bacterium CG_4_10_14_0_2_um_filter_63_37]